MAKIIKYAMRKCMGRLTAWKQENPDYHDVGSALSSRRRRIMGNAMKTNGGANPDQLIRDRLCVDAIHIPSSLIWNRSNQRRGYMNN